VPFLHLIRVRAVGILTAVMVATPGCGQQPAAIAQRSAAIRLAARELALTLPLRDDSVRFAVIGDSGTGGLHQWRVAERLAAAHTKFPFAFVLMLGDNLYGSEDPEDYRDKFERPYGILLGEGVTFHAVLGNHDDPSQRFYEGFNMGGKRFYSFKKGSVRFFALDSNYMDPSQLEWLDDELCESQADWKIALFHHPIYSSGKRHGSDLRLREVLEPMFNEHGVDVVLAGHDHFYERLKPQKGIHYFVSGGAAKLRRGDIQETPIFAAGFDQGYHFMLMEIARNRLYFQVISGAGKTVDSGTISRPADPNASKPCSQG
jgi:predicted phosphodiesterase